MPLRPPFMQYLAGAVGFEPTVHGTKTRCLTTWLRPSVQAELQSARIIIIIRSDFHSASPCGIANSLVAWFSIPVFSSKNTNRLVPPAGGLVCDFDYLVVCVLSEP